MRCTPSTRSFGTQTTAPKTDASAASTSTKANTKPAGVNIFTNEKLYSGKTLEASFYTKKFFDDVFSKNFLERTVIMKTF